MEVFDEVGRLYRVRSRIVHGDGRMSRVNRTEAERVAQLGFDTGKETLVKLLQRHVLPIWRRVVLSAE